MKKEVKSRVTTKKRLKLKKKNIFLIPFAFISITLILLIYLLLGKEFAFIATIFIAIIFLVIVMLNNIKNTKRRKKIMNLILVTLLTGSIILVVTFCIFIIFIKTKAEPKFKASELNTPEMSIIYDKDDKEITRLGSERREKITYDKLPEVFIDALIATEDSRFFQHNGFDAPRFIKASLGQALGQASGGASTLSMQVVKNVFTNAKEKTGVTGVIRKFEDIYLAVYKLEAKYSKQEIIEFYINNHFLGNNIYGVQEASYAYFGKSASDLNLSEAAIIAGMFQSPNYYRPNVNPKIASKRRATVLYLMKRHGYITAEEEKIANSIPIESLTVPEEKRTTKYSGYIDTVVAEVKQKYGVNPYVQSLKIYTNLDRNKQDAVDKVLNGETYTWKDEKLQTGVAVLEASTGKIQAIGAGRNKATGVNTWNNATNLKRQPGSTAKPLFDYGPGIEYNNWSTAQMFDDAPYSYSNGQKIKNWDNGYFGNITLRKALATSRNIPALKAFQQVENKKIIKFVTSLGIKPEIDSGRIHEAHSIGGFTGVSPLEMAGAYAAFANGGYYNKPYAVRKVEFRVSGRVEEHRTDKKQVMSDATAFMITSVLQDVRLNGGGTPNNIAVKTGTTNYDSDTMRKHKLPSDATRDSWAVGYSTKTVLAMWYGYDKIDPVYVLRNIPAAIAKDREFVALVNSGAIESNRESFKAPNSVSKMGSEYYKKGFEPEKPPVEEKLSAPSSLKVSYSPATHSVNISWNAVARLENDSEYGEFGYKVYKDGTLLGWTTSLSYNLSTTSPSGSYKVIASYKGYSGVESASATNNYKYIEQTPSPSPTPKPAETILTKPECEAAGYTWTTTTIPPKCIKN